MLHTALDGPAALVLDAERLRADLPATRARSAALIDCGYARRRRHPFRIIRGSSDAGDAKLWANAIINAVFGARLCLDCIARKAGVSVEQASALLSTIAGGIHLTIGPHRCDLCL